MTSIHKHVHQDFKILDADLPKMNQTKRFHWGPSKNDVCDICKIFGVRNPSTCLVHVSPNLSCLFINTIGRFFDPPSHKGICVDSPSVQRSCLDGPS